MKARRAPPTAPTRPFSHRLPVLTAAMWTGPDALRDAGYDDWHQAGRSGGGAQVGLPPVSIAIGETVILLTPPLPLVGVSIDMARECEQNDSLADG